MDRRDAAPEPRVPASLDDPGSEYDRGLVAVGNSPALANLVELDVSGTLRSGMPPLHDAACLDSLRVLRIRSCFHMDHADKLLDWPVVRRIELLDLRCSGTPNDTFVARLPTYDGIALYSPT